MAFEPYKLSDTDKERMLEMEDDIRLMEQELIKAKRAGIDVAGIQERFDKMKRLREGILREYA